MNAFEVVTGCSFWDDGGGGDGGGRMSAVLEVEEERDVMEGGINGLLVFRRMKSSLSLALLNRMCF